MGCRDGTGRYQLGYREAAWSPPASWVVPWPYFSPRCRDTLVTGSSCFGALDQACQALPLCLWSLRCPMSWAHVAAPSSWSDLGPCVLTQPWTSFLVPTGTGTAGSWLLRACTPIPSSQQLPGQRLSGHCPGPRVPAPGFAPWQRLGVHHWGKVCVSSTCRCYCFHFTDKLKLRENDSILRKSLSGEGRLQVRGLGASHSVCPWRDLEMLPEWGGHHL